MSSGELRQLGQYQLRELLGRGGMAKVYRAFQPNINREVAVKVLSSQFVKDPTFRERFRREAQAVGKLRHPNIMVVFDFGYEGETPYIVSELINGKSLREYMGEPLDYRFVAHVLNQIASALDYAHENGVVHRDVKPTNILLDNRNRAVLTDFGIAKLMQPNSPALTTAGTGVGTPEYMSPEQGLGESLDGRCDQYSLGIVLYEMLTGVTPYRAEAPLTILMSHVYKPLPEPTQFNNRLPAPIVAVIKKALSKRPVDRYNSCSELAHAFEQAAGLPPSAPVSSGALLETRPINVSDRLRGTGALPQQGQAALPSSQPGISQNLPGMPYTPPGTDEGGSSRTRLFVLIGAGVVVLLAVIILIVVLATGGGSNQGAITTTVATATRTTTTAATTAASTTSATATTTVATTTAVTTTPPTTVATTAAPATLAAPDPQLANGLKVAITGLPGNVAGAIVIPNGQGVEQNFNQPVPGASLLYLWIAATAYEEEAGGRFPLGETYTLKASDQVQGTGILKNADRVGKSFSYAELVETMLVYSDHTAASLVLNRLGLAKVNDYARRNDYRVTTIQVNPASPEAATKNLTSARDCALIIDNLLKKKVVSTPVSEKILSELKTRRAYEDISTDFFGRNVPDNLDYTHISGVLPGVRNELGYYVTKSGGPVIIVLLSSNNSGTEAAVETALGQSIAQVLKTVP